MHKVKSGNQILIVVFAALSAATALAQPIELTFLTGAGGIGGAMRRGVEVCNAEHVDEFKVSMVEIPYSDLLNQEMLQFISGKPNFDVFTGASSWWMRLRPFVEPLNTYIDRDGQEAVAALGALPNSYRLSGQQLGLPVRAGVTILYYRKDLLDEAGLDVPQTLDELEEAARALTVDRNGNGDPEVFGFSWTMGERRWTTKHVSQLLFGHGYRFLTEDFSEVDPELNSGDVVRLVDFMRRLTDDGLTPNPLGWNYEDNVLLFQQGKLAMSFEDSVRVGLLEDPEVSTVAGKMGYSVVPHAEWGPMPVAYEGGGHALGMPNTISAEKKEAVWQFMKCMIGREAQLEMAVNGANGPTMLDIYDAPEYDSPAAQAVKESLATGVRFVLPIERIEEVQNAFQQDVHNFMLGRMSPEELVSALKRTLERNMR
jgi:multiple sugar transport system substrate-binding protein